MGKTAASPPCECQEMAGFLRLSTSPPVGTVAMPDCGFFLPGPKLTAPLLAAAVQAVLSLGSRAKISSDSCAPILSCQRLVWREASRGMGCPQEL
ncbi:hypothetical protein LEMLEM_LOCUS16439 [Lemmus lemmus]